MCRMQVKPSATPTPPRPTPPSPTVVLQPPPTQGAIYNAQYQSYVLPIQIQGHSVQVSILQWSLPCWYLICLKIKWSNFVFVYSHLRCIRIPWQQSVKENTQELKVHMRGILTATRPTHTCVFIILYLSQVLWWTLVQTTALQHPLWFRPLHQQPVLLWWPLRTLHLMCSITRSSQPWPIILDRYIHANFQLFLNATEWKVQYVQCRT